MSVCLSVCLSVCVSLSLGLSKHLEEDLEQLVVGQPFLVANEDVGAVRNKDTIQLFQEARGVGVLRALWWLS